MFRVVIDRTLSLMALLALGLSTTLSAAAGAGNTIRGSAQNLSRNQPAAGDEVTLVRLERTPDEGMQQNTEAHSKTDAQGGFSFAARYPDKVYLVRVVHQGVSYDQQASPGDNLSISVFDAAPKVSTITGSIEIVRIGTRVAANQKFLHVSDMYELRNDSRPPMTQAGASTFDVYLPANAKLDSVLAAGPSSNLRAVHDKIGLMVPASPVSGEAGHYTVNFPLRPGATKFAFNYDVPYQGHASFHVRREYRVQQFAVMTPPTMHFSSGPRFQELPTRENEYQVHAAMQLEAGRGPAFEISGDGPLPSLHAQNQAPRQVPVLPSSTVHGSAAVLPASPPPHPDSKSEKTPPLWLWQALTGLLTLICIVLFLHAREQRLARRRELGAAPPGILPTAWLTLPESVKEELFQLEVDRARGLISADEYCSARLALAETAKRMVVGPKNGGAILVEPSENRGRSTDLPESDRAFEA